MDKAGLKILLGLWIMGVIALAFFWAPTMTRPNYSTGELEPWATFRIVFFHVPAAWTCVIAFLVSMIAGIRVLRTGSVREDDRAMASAQLGLLFAVLALVSGMIWARHDWGSFWNWDPRQSSVLILVLIYSGYFTLRGAIDDPRRRSRLAAVYSIVSFVAVPFLVFVVPRIMFSLHPSPVIPNDADKGSMDGAMRIVLYSMVFGFIGLFAWLMSLRMRLEVLRRQQLEESV